MPTVSEIINIAKVSQYLSANKIAQNSVFGGGISESFPRKLYIERKSVEFKYRYDPTNTTDLVKCANYLYALCAPFSFLATAIVAAGGGGSVVNPVTPGGGASKYLIYINSADFESDGVSYNNSKIVGDNLSIFINEYTQQWLFAPDSFVYTPTGFQIVIPGFDASTQDYNIIITDIKTA